MNVFEISQPLRLPLPGMPARQVLAIGDFDGVHLGHQEVIRRAIRTADEEGIPSAVMTFHPHPRQVLGLNKYREILTPLPDKLDIFRSLGVDSVYIVAFDKALAGMEPADFVDQVLVPMGTASVIVGFDFTFGRGGRGTAESLVGFAAGRFTVEIVRPFIRDGGKVSSTLIREHLLEGRLELANGLLGRPYAIRGSVVTGEGRGRTIGYPTANVQPDQPYLIPANGVYAVRVRTGSGTYGGVMNVGVKPTFTDNGGRTLEAHLFGYSGSLYGETVEVQLLAALRAERKFAGAAELVEQIHRDAERAKEVLNEVN